MSKTVGPEPAIPDEEFDENATVRLPDFSELTEMSHELKDKFEALKLKKNIENDCAQEW